MHDHMATYDKISLYDVKTQSRDYLVLANLISILWSKIKHDIMTTCKNTNNKTSFFFFNILHINEQMINKTNQSTFFLVEEGFFKIQNRVIIYIYFKIGK